jgi:hypothetical protein
VLQVLNKQELDIFLQSTEGQNDGVADEVQYVCSFVVQSDNYDYVNGPYGQVYDWMTSNFDAEHDGLTCTGFKQVCIVGKALHTTYDSLSLKLVCCS